MHCVSSEVIVCCNDSEKNASTEVICHSSLIICPGVISYNGETSIMYVLGQCPSWHKATEDIVKRNTL